MPIIATPGGSTSNSYVTVAEATALLADELVDVTAWTAATEDDKTRALITAARMLDVSIRWHGTRYSSSQALAWPMHLYPYVYVHGIPSVSPPSWPEDIAIAQSLLAAWLLAQRAASLPIGASSSGDVVSGLKVGPISIAFAASSPQAPTGTTIPDHVWIRLMPYGSRAGGVCVPLVRT